MTQTMPIFGVPMELSYSSGTLYFPLNGASSIAESFTRCYVPTGKSVKLCVYLRAISLNAGRVTVTVRKNGVNTAQSIVLTFDEIVGLFTDSDVVSFADGDYLNLQVVVTGATNGGVDLVVTVHWQ